jgi:hypothetical protein
LIRFLKRREKPFIELLSDHFRHFPSGLAEAIEDGKKKVTARCHGAFVHRRRHKDIDTVIVNRDGQ